MIDILQNNEISVILMHGFMQNEDKKSSVDIVKEVSDFFYEKIEFLKKVLDIYKYYGEDATAERKNFLDDMAKTRTPGNAIEVFLNGEKVFQYASGYSDLENTLYSNQIQVFMYRSQLLPYPRHSRNQRASKCEHSLHQHIV